MTDLDDLLGPDPAAPEPTDPVSTDLGAVTYGVSISWLGQVFSMHPQSIKKRLAECPPIKGSHGNKPLFDLKQAASYLVNPKGNLEEHIKRMRPNDLPPYLQSEFWKARLARQKWEQNAGDLWRTDDVRDVLAEAFKRIKEGMQLWVDNLGRAEGLTDKQRTALVSMVDGLQDDLHARLIQMPLERSTQSQLAEVDGETGETE